MAIDQSELVRRHYGAWAATYGTASEGWFRWVRARERRLVAKLLDLGGVRRSILDVGCGSGLYARPLHQQGHEVWALDLAPEMVEQVRGQVDRCMVADVEDLRLDRYFDRILCLGVLEYVRDPQSVVARLVQHLAPCGRLIVLVPRTGPGGWVYQREKRKHGLSVTLFDPSSLRRIGERSGARYLGQRTPFPHNVVMAFEGPPVALCPQPRQLLE